MERDASVKSVRSSLLCSFDGFFRTHRESLCLRETRMLVDKFTVSAAYALGLAELPPRCTARYSLAACSIPQEIVEIEVLFTT